MIARARAPRTSPAEPRPVGDAPDLAAWTSLPSKQRIWAPGGRQTLLRVVESGFGDRETPTDAKSRTSEARPSSRSHGVEGKTQLIAPIRMEWGPSQINSQACMYLTGNQGTRWAGGLLSLHVHNQQIRELRRPIAHGTCQDLEGVLLAGAP